RTQCPVYIAPSTLRLQRVYNLLVKYRLMRRVVHNATSGRDYDDKVLLERFSVAKRWALASTSCTLSICIFHSEGVHTSKYSPCPATINSPLARPRNSRRFCGTRMRPT